MRRSGYLLLVLVSLFFTLQLTKDTYAQGCVPTYSDSEDVDYWPNSWTFVKQVYYYLNFPDSYHVIDWLVEEGGGIPGRVWDIML